MKPTHLRMLIVDDDLLIGVMIQEFFKPEENYEVFLAMDGQEAWDMCNIHKPHVLITDLMLPKMSGIDLITKLRATDEFAVMPIIAISAGTPGMREMAKQAGAHLVLEKPIRRIELTQRVDELLAASPFLPRNET
jgi:DNA-binding response OmpR family regulator